MFTDLLAMMRLYMIQTGSPMLVDNQRDIKIGYYHEQGDETIKYYLTAAEEDNFEVSATEVRKWFTLNRYSYLVNIDDFKGGLGGHCPSVEKEVVKTLEEMLKYVYALVLLTHIFSISPSILDLF